MSCICVECGAEHEGLLTEFGWNLPDDVWALPEAERVQRATWDSDLCKMDDRYFIRCTLHVPFAQREGDFVWGVWVEVAEPDFARFIELYDGDGRSEPPKRGTLANAIAGYEDAAREPVSIQFGTISGRPEATTDAQSQSSLAVDQHRGIDNARYHTLAVIRGSL